VSLPKAEELFHQLSSTDDPDLIRMVSQWQPWYRYRNDEDGNRLIAQFRKRGINPCLTATISHDRLVSLAIDAAQNADVAGAASAFVCATNPERENAPLWLNPLRAVSVIRNMPKHRFQRSGEDDEISEFEQCVTCGEVRKAAWEPVYAVSNLPSGWCGEDYEVMKHVMIARWFHQTDPPKVTSQDKSAFRRFLKAISDASKKATALQVSQVLLKEIKGLVEWSFHLEALGFAGVLKTDKQPGNLQQWVNHCDRKKRITVEMRTPACHWRRHMGFDSEVFAQLFPDVTLPAKLRSIQTGDTP
jgi:hypothetical protein